VAAESLEGAVGANHVGSGHVVCRTKVLLACASGATRAALSGRRREPPEGLPFVPFLIRQAQGITLVRAKLALHAESFVHDGNLELTGLRSNQAFRLATVFAELPKHRIGHSVKPS
jgi:hypothetical protein